MGGSARFGLTDAQSIAANRRAMIAGSRSAEGKAFDLRGRRAVDPAAHLTYVLIALQVVFLLLVLASGAFALDPALVRACFGESALVVLFACAVRWLRFERIATMIEIAVLLIVVGTLTTVNSLILASLELPLADAVLARIDRVAFGFDRDMLAMWLSGQPEFMRVSNWIYHSTALSTLLLFAALLWRCGTRAAWRVLAALQIASLICLCLFALVPAFGTPPYAYSFEGVLTALRDGSLRTITQSSLTGVVTFPSMHAAGGLLLAWGFVRTGRLAMPFVALNILMIGSAITSGGHYLIDVIAGMLVAIAAIRLSSRVERGGTGFSVPPRRDRLQSVPSVA